MKRTASVSSVATSQDVAEVQARPVKLLKSSNDAKEQPSQEQRIQKQQALVPMSRLLSLPTELRVEMFRPMFPSTKIRTIRIASSGLAWYTAITLTTHGGRIYDDFYIARRDLPKLPQLPFTCQQVYNDTRHLMVKHHGVFTLENISMTIPEDEISRQKDYIKLTPYLGEINVLEVNRTRLPKPDGDVFTHCKVDQMSALERVEIYSSAYTRLEPVPNMDRKIRYSIDKIHESGEYSILAITP